MSSDGNWFASLFLSSNNCKACNCRRVVEWSGSDPEPDDFAIPFPFSFALFPRSETNFSTNSAPALAIYKGKKFCTRVRFSFQTFNDFLQRDLVVTYLLQLLYRDHKRFWLDFNRHIVIVVVVLADMWPHMFSFGGLQVHRSMTLQISKADAANYLLSAHFSSF